jgi:hypothetical protein
MSIQSLTFSTLLLLFSAVTATAGTALVVVEGCEYVCAAHCNDEISHIYSKTDEGNIAPNQGIVFHTPRPVGITFARGVYFTPTFSLMVDGLEASRLAGYPSEELVWRLPGQTPIRANIDVIG